MTKCRLTGNSPSFFDRLLNAENVRKNLPFVVGRAARKNVAVLQHRIERRRIPQLERIGRLHVVMPVNQNRAATFSMLIARPNDRMTRSRNQFRLQSDAAQFLNQPMRAFGELFRIIVVRGNARESQKRIEIFKMTGAHPHIVTRDTLASEHSFFEITARVKNNL